MPDSVSERFDALRSRRGLDDDYLARVMRIESGGNPNARTGSYRGLYQLSPKEFSRWGGTGSIYDPQQNTQAFINKTAAEKAAFEQKYGRPASPTDLYMVHQQGQAGYGAHLSNPSGTAWQNVRQYYPSEKVAKAAVWGNVPDNLKPVFGSVDNVTSQSLIDIYAKKMGGETSGWQASVGAGRGYMPSQARLSSPVGGPPPPVDLASLESRPAATTSAWPQFTVPQVAPQAAAAPAPMVSAPPPMAAPDWSLVARYARGF